MTSKTRRVCQPSFYTGRHTLPIYVYPEEKHRLLSFYYPTLRRARILHVGIFTPAEAMLRIPPALRHIIFTIYYTYTRYLFKIFEKLNLVKRALFHGSVLSDTSLSYDIFQRKLFIRVLCVKR